MCGSSTASSFAAPLMPPDINPDERQWVSQLDDFLKIATKSGYQRLFPDKKNGTPLDHLGIYRTFFRGPEFRPSAFSFLNFQIFGDVVFPHPDGLYKEYKAIKRDDPRAPSTSSAVGLLHPRRQSRHD